jgi:predicted Zn-dependent protease
VIWIANNGQPADEAALRKRLTDDNPLVRGLAEQGVWALWSRSGDDAIDQLMAKGAVQLESGQLDDAIATYSEIIKRKPAFAEGWNKRATVLFLAGDYKRSLADCDEVMKRNPITSVLWRVTGRSISGSSSTGRQSATGNVRCR